MRSRVRIGSRPLLLVALTQLCWVSSARAVAPPTDPSPFDMIGFIQAATLNPACTSTDPLCDGTITINNQLIVVPRNTLLQMPAAAFTWQDVFVNAPAPYGIPGNPGVTAPVAMTGLAMADIPAPPVTYEAHVVGNRVGDQYVAGLLFLSQHSLQSSQGYVNFIDYTTGVFEVGGAIGVQGTGQRVQVNDPLGKFGRAWTPDQRFTIDENNPTVRSETGFPMCLPRADPASAKPDDLCPEANRPLDATSPSGKLMIFTMPDPLLVVKGGPDPRLMAPFEVGDYVTYSGVLVNDPAPATTTSIAAYQVIGNVGIFTAPGTSPAYVATDVMLLGVGGQNIVGVAEATARTRFEGFTTDPSRNILLYGVDVDPCTGLQTPRAWGSIDVDQGPPTGAVRGRWRFRPPSKILTGPPAGTYLPATREMRAVIETTAGSGLPSPAYPPLGAPTAGANLYQAPIFEFLFPENAGVGTPVVPNNFETMPFLAQGSGPLGTGGPIVGQLNLWPGLPAPAVAVCNVAGTPVATAGANPTTAASGAVVQLTGACTIPGVGPCTGTTTFAWTAPAGVALSSNTVASPTFTAPIVPFGAASTLSFQLVVTNDGVALAPASVSVTVNPVVSDGVSIGLVQYRIGKQRLTINAGSTASTAVPPAVLAAQAFDASGAPQWAPLTMTLSGGVYVLDLIGAPQPTTVKVVSDHGGSASSGITSLRQ